MGSRAPDSSNLPWMGVEMGIGDALAGCFWIVFWELRPCRGPCLFCFKSGNPPSVIMYSTYLHQDRIGPCHTRHASLQALPAWHGWFRLLGGRNDYHRPQVGGGIWVHKNAPKIMNFVKTFPFFYVGCWLSSAPKMGAVFFGTNFAGAGFQRFSLRGWEYPPNPSGTSNLALRKDPPK